MRTAALAAVVLAWSCGARPEPVAPETPPAERSFEGEAWRELAPAGPIEVAVLDVGQLVRWPGLAALAESLASEPLAVARAAGCDLEAGDLGRVAWLRYDDGDLVVVRGRFASEPALACIRAVVAERGGRIAERRVRGHQVWLSERIGDRARAVLPRPGLALVATSPAVLDRLLAAATPRASEAPGWLASVAPEDAGAVLWAAGGPRSWLGRALRRQGLELDLVWSAASLERAGDGAIAVAGARARSAEDAARLASLIELTAEGARPVLVERGLGAALDRLELRTDGESVRARLALDGADLRALGAQDRRSR